ncbi:hypothetical protein H8959_018953 [Pygathrix nigripes]
MSPGRPPLGRRHLLEPKRGSPRRDPGHRNNLALGPYSQARRSKRPASPTPPCVGCSLFVPAARRDSLCPPERGKVGGCSPELSFPDLPTIPPLRD